MLEQLQTGDYLAVAGYFVLVLGVGIWASIRRGTNSTESYFLAGKHMTWLPVGASLFASNVGAPMFIGLAGAGAASGYSVVLYEWAAVFLLVALGWFFVPVFVASGAYTMPEYLMKRFGGVRLRICLSILSLFLYVLTKISAEIYCGALFMQLLLGWNLYICIISILAVTAVYTVIGPPWIGYPEGYLLTYTQIHFGKVPGGIRQEARRRNGIACIISGIGIITSLFFPTFGMTSCHIADSASKGGIVAVMYTDTLQTVIISIGACVLTYRGFQEIHGFDGLEKGFVTAVSNITKTNVTHYSCGLPPKDSLHIWRDPVHGDIPWPGAVFGLLIIGSWVWCTDQLMVQRTLTAKNISHAKGGSLLAGALKILPFFLWIIPGMISRILYPDEIACSSPERCYEVCQNKAGCTNIAYPILVLRLLPEGLRGLMLAALLAALMSSLTSIFNSASSMFTIDIWPRIRKKPSENELMIVGRIAVLACTAIGILWLPVLQYAQGGQLWGYLQSVTAYTAPPWTTLFMFALLWKRTSEQGAFWGLNAGLVVGIIRMVVDFTYPAPYCGSGEEDTRPGVLKHVHFLYFSMISATVTSIVIVLVSLCTAPRTEAQLGRTIWWTRHHAAPDLELEEGSDGADGNKIEDNGDTDDSDSEKERNDGAVGESTFSTGNITQPTDIQSGVDDVKVQSYKGKRTNMDACKHIGMWMCGMTQRRSQRLSSTERFAIQKRFTSLEEDKSTKSALNIIAIGLLMLTVFLCGYFS